MGALIFVPLERLFALHRDQKILRRGWRADIIHFLFTRTLSDICAFVIVGAILVLVHWLVNPAFQATVASQNRLLQFAEAVVIANIGGYTLHAVFIHANLAIKFGPLRWLIGTPEFHHWHHSADPEAHNKNFAGELPLLDLLFGTFYLPKGLMPATYGTSEPVPNGYFGQMLHPFRSQGPGPR